MLAFHFFNKDTTSQNIYIKSYSIISRKDQKKQYSKFFLKRSGQDEVSGTKEQEWESCTRRDK